MREKLKSQIETMVKPRYPQPTVQCVDNCCELSGGGTGSPYHIGKELYGIL